MKGYKRQNVPIKIESDRKIHKVQVKQSRSGNLVGYNDSSLYWYIFINIGGNEN